MVGAMAGLDRLSSAALQPMKILIVIVYTITYTFASPQARGGTVNSPSMTDCSGTTEKIHVLPVLPNTLSTTAHIHDLLFRPGSGAYGSPCAPADQPSTRTPSLRTTPSRTSSLTPSSTSSLRTMPSRTSSLRTMPSTTSIVGATSSTYQDTLLIPFSEHLKHILKPSDGGDARHEAIRGTLLYFLTSTENWVHTIVLHSPDREVVTVRIVVCLGVIVMICSILAMMRAHGLHGGAHHQLGTLPGGHTPLDPRRDMHSRIPPVYNPETDRQYSFRRYL